MIRLNHLRVSIVSAWLFAIGLLLTTCSLDKDTKKPLDYELSDIPIPATWGGEPNFAKNEQGELWLSWLEYLNDSLSALQVVALKNGIPGDPIVVDTGSNWFVNWADFPSVAPFGTKGEMAAHWLQKSAEWTFDYDVRIAISTDDGKTWPTEFIPHHDGVAAEHGFVSLVPLPENQMFAVWLDGRHTKTEVDGNKGAMTLHAAIFDNEGEIREDYELDSRICDCCQTAATLTDEGLVVAYRDRSETEVRDIYVVRQTESGWTEPVAVHEDNWLINGCPVNGPALDARGKKVALAWFTAADGVPQVKLALSGDAGKTFSAPIRLDEEVALGRVDVSWVSDTEVWVSWTESGEQSGAIQLARLNAAGEVLQKGAVAKTDPSRKSGFPRLAAGRAGVYLAWTEITDEGLTKVRLAQVRVP